MEVSLCGILMLRTETKQKSCTVEWVVFLPVERKEEMDLWAVAAVAVSGYLATCWRNLTNAEDNLKEPLCRDSAFAKSSSPPLIQHIHEKICPFRRKRLREEDASRKGENNPDGKVSEVSQTSCTSGAQVKFSSGCEVEKLLPFDDCEDSNACSVSKSDKCFQEIGNGDGPSSCVDNTSRNSLFEPSTAKMGSFRGSLRKIRSLRSMQSCMRFGRPLSSLDSCLLFYLYKERDELEEHLINSLPSPSAQTIRPFFVIDGSQIISQASEISCNSWSETDQNKQPKETYVEQNKNVSGIPPLPRVISMKIPRELKPMTGKVQGGRLSIPSKILNGEPSHSQGDKKLLLSLGIFIGMVTSLFSNKREVEKLRELLKQTENLVQDLQEEIEMKDAITVKELVNEGYDSQNSSNHSFHDVKPRALTPALEKVAKYDSEGFNGRRENENSEHMRTIEAELEAELERLELSVNASNLEKGSPYIVEFNPSTSSTSTAVSPRELSLRLHEAIQSRLEERVRELETALETSQRKVRELESKQLYSWREYPDDPESESSPSHLEEMETLGADEDEPREGLYPFDESFSSSVLNRALDREISEELSSVVGDENGDGDEMEKLLIKQIVERTKQGSPALLNAQRALFSMVENQHRNE